MEYGIVYLLTNPVMPGLVKIGMTTQEDIDKRMKELYTTGVPVPFECQFACKVKKGDCAKIEKALHTAFAPQRINANREFFRIQVEQAKAIFQLCSIYRLMLQCRNVCHVQDHYRRNIHTGKLG